MDIIQNNPFRILGLPVTASDREIAKRVNDLSTFCEFGKQKHYDDDFLFISDFERTTESVERAASQIELPEQKLLYSNFWFWRGNSIDDLVFEVLKDGNVDKALELWRHPIERNDISFKRLSNYKNYALLNLIISLQNEAIDVDKFRQSVSHFVSVFSDTSYLEFINAITGKTHTASATQTQKTFIDQVYKNIFQQTDSNERISSREFLNCFNSANIEVTQFVSGKFVAEPIHKIEKAIAHTSVIRNNDPDLAYVTAKEMLSDTEQSINFLKNVLSQNDIQLQTILDKLAEELLSCSTAFYNAIYEEDKKLAIEKSRELTNHAKRLACGHATKQRVADDIEQIKSLEKSDKLSHHIEKIVEQLNTIPKQDSISSSQLHSLPLLLNRLIANTRTPMAALENSGPEGKQHYFGFGNIIAQVCLGCCVHYANETNDYSSVIGILEKIAVLPMEADVRAHYLTNLKVLSQNIVVKSANERAAASSGVCYVATLVYGGYDTPQVMKLRKFRDNVLMQYSAGRCFVHIYYLISPYLVNTLGNHNRVQNLIRSLLDKLVARLK